MPPLPPVEKVRPGIWSLPVPIPDNPLGYTLVYLLDSDQGPVLVDTGWDDDASFAYLAKRITEAGFDLADVYGVLVTHHHPDHHGLSGRVQAASGAWIAMHTDDAEVVTRRRESGDDWILMTAHYLLDAGAGEDALASLPPADEMIDHRPPAPTLPNRLIADGEQVDVPGWEVRAIHTPGHTPGHTCFVVPAEDVVLTGDCVLPRISPHIGLMHPDLDDADHLGDYLVSLRRLRDGHASAEAFPAHEHRFADLAGRIDELLGHHEARLDELRAILGHGGALAGWDISERMTWSRDWSEIHFMMRRAAVAEVVAHLRHLERIGEVEVYAASSPTTYRLTG